MKKILILLIAILGFIANVNAEVNFDENFKINFDNLIKVQNLVDEKYIISRIVSTDEEFNGLTFAGIQNLGKYYYSVNNSEEYEVTGNAFEGSSALGFNIKEQLKTTNEIKLKVIFVTNDGKRYETNEEEVLVLEEDNELFEKEKYYDEETGIKVLASDLPYNTKITTQKITDENLLKKVGYEKPSIFKVNITSYGKDLKYYADKYNYSLFTIKLLLPVDKKYNYDASSNEVQLLGQILDSNFKTLDTFVDMDDEDSTYFYTGIIKEEYLDDYFVLSTNIEFTWDESSDEKDSVWENFVKKYKETELLKIYGDAVVTHTDSTMKVTIEDNETTRETNFEYKNGIVSYVPTEDEVQAILDAPFVINCLYAISEIKNYDIDSVIEWFEDNPSLTLEKDGIEYKLVSAKLEQNGENVSGSFSSDTFESFKLDIKNGLKTYNAKEETKKEPLEEEKIPENPHTGMTKGIITLVELLILGVLFFVIKNKKVSFSKIKK